MTSHKNKNHCLCCFSGFARNREKPSKGKIPERQSCLDSKCWQKPCSQETEPWTSNKRGVWGAGPEILMGVYKGSWRDPRRLVLWPPAERNVILLGGNHPQCKPLVFPQIKISKYGLTIYYHYRNTEMRKQQEIVHNRAVFEAN